MLVSHSNRCRDFFTNHLHVNADFPQDVKMFDKFSNNLKVKFVYFNTCPQPRYDRFLTDLLLTKHQELTRFLDRLGYFGCVHKQGVLVWTQILYVGQDCDLDVWVTVSQRFIKDHQLHGLNQSGWQEFSSLQEKKYYNLSRFLKQ